MASSARIFSLPTLKTKLGLQTSLQPCWRQPCRKLHGSTSEKTSNGIGIAAPLFGAIAISFAGGIKSMHDHVEGSEGLVRSLSFYKFAVPKYIEYRFHMFKESPDHVWDELDKDTSAIALDLAYELEGFYMKGGQMIAANIAHAFPQIWQDTMTVLQDQVPPQESSVIKGIVASELDFDSVFATFGEKPIGSAAIGQVHRATLIDGTP